MPTEPMPNTTRLHRRRRWLFLSIFAIVVLSLAAVAYLGGPRRAAWWINRVVIQPTRPPGPAATRSERWLQDLEYLRTNLHRLHANAFHTTPREAFERAFEEARERLVGEPTADARGGWGEVRSFTLPNSRIQVWVSTYHFGGDPNPVEPDVRAIPTASGWLAGEDPVLNAALGR